MKNHVFFCNGQCYPYAFCYTPFDDAGKECTNSNQCKGYCKGNYSDIADKYYGKYGPGGKVKCDSDDVCEGSCSQIPKPSDCIWYFEVDDGYYIFHGGGWC